jgi:hypothetical protein
MPDYCIPRPRFQHEIEREGDWSFSAWRYSLEEVDSSASLVLREPCCGSPGVGDELSACSVIAVQPQGMRLSTAHIDALLTTPIRRVTVDGALSLHCGWLSSRSVVVHKTFIAPDGVKFCTANFRYVSD